MPPKSRKDNCLKADRCFTTMTRSCSTGYSLWAPESSHMVLNAKTACLSQFTGREGLFLLCFEFAKNSMLIFISLQFKCNEMLDCFHSTSSFVNTWTHGSQTLRNPSQLIIYAAHLNNNVYGVWNPVWIFVQGIYSNLMWITAMDIHC